MIKWIKQHKIVTILFLFFAYYVFSDLFGKFSALRIASKSVALPALSGTGISSMDYGSAKTINSLSVGEANYTPTPEQTNRLVIQNSSVSLLVSNVRKSADTVLEYAAGIGGYMVNSFFNNPGEAQSATVVIRIPSDKLKESLEFFRQNSLKVVSEQLEGTDVTDEYTDINARLTTLNITKKKFETMLDKATTVTETLNVEREIINLQAQIDSLVGQQKYLEKSSQMVKISVSLSTDEYSLPYAPSNSWRVNVIFKQAVRSLVLTLQDVGSLIIWIAVYSIIWLPLLIAGFLGYRKFRK